MNWSWKPDDKEVYKPIKKPKMKTLTKSQRRKQKKQAKRELAKSLLPQDFYTSKEWRSLRYRVLRKYDGCCMLCGRSKKFHNIVLHVDHIRPRSKYPHLALTFENLQILCEDCNLGKSNKDDTDWRPDIDGEALDLEHLSTLEVFN